MYFNDSPGVNSILFVRLTKISILKRKTIPKYAQIVDKEGEQF